jgi:hypothetical protein
LSHSLNIALFGVIALIRFAHMFLVTTFALGANNRVIIIADLVNKAVREGTTAPSVFTLRVR